MTSEAVGRIEAALKAVHEDQAVEKKHKETIARCYQLIAEKEGGIKALAVPDREDLYERRESIRAALALGENVSLVPIGVEIARYEIDVKTSELKTGPLKAEIVGLQKRIAQEEEGLRGLAQPHKDRMHAFHMSEAEQTWEEYVRTAEVLADLFARLCALNVLLGEGNILGIDQQTRFHIPTMRAFAGNRECLHDASEVTGPGRMDVILNAEKERLRAMGVEL